MKNLTLILGQFFSFALPLAEACERFKLYFKTGLRRKRFLHFGKDSLLGLHTVYRGEKYISIGARCFIGSYSMLTAWDEYNGQAFSPRITIGDNCYIGSQTHITAINRIEIGNNVLTGTKVLITDNSHGKFSKEELTIAPTQRPLYSKGAVIIEDNVWIGEKATICPNVHIGTGAVIAANSVVTHDVPAFCMVAGAPAKIVKQLNPS